MTGINEKQEAARSERAELVIRIAHEMFERDGYEHVGIRQICTAAGLSPMQLYRLGLDKKDLLAEVVLRINQQIIDRIKPFSSKGFKSVEDFIDRYLLDLYTQDIAIKGIRAEGAAFGWKWSGRYEELIIRQIFKMIQPIVDALQHDGYDEIPARCYAIWSLYYVGYRHAVMHDGDAAACLAQIRPSLALCLKR